MVRITLLMVAALWPAAAFAAGPPDAPQQATGVVSADRVSEGLKRPELQIPPLPPPPVIFRSEVTVKLETPLDVIRRELREEARRHPWEGGHYTQGIDLMPSLVSLVTKIRTIRREHQEAEARQMVQRELEDFCSQHDCSQVAEQPLEGLILPQ